MVGFVWFCIGAALGADVVMLIALNKFEEKSDFEKGSGKGQVEDKEEKKARGPPAIGV